MITNQRGVALPMALIVLMLLLSLTVAFAVLAGSEPVIANNHLRSIQARALAESGIERAVWALANPAAPEGLTDPLPSPVPSPYDGRIFIELGTGGFFLTVGSGALANERDIVAAGWTPTWEATDPRVKAHSRVAATLTRLRDVARDAPCALCVRGDVELSGAAAIDARPSAGTICGDKYAVWATGAVDLTGNARVHGADGNATANEPTDYAAAQASSAFDAFALTGPDLDQLRGFAKAHGAYLRGAVAFHRVPNGLVFVDTVSGRTPTRATAAADLARVTIGPGAFADPSGFHGWIVVAGDIAFTGDFGGIAGMVYALGDVTAAGMGRAGITGLLIAERARGGGSKFTGGASVTYDCAAARGGGQIPTGWYVKAGTYRELSD